MVPVITLFEQAMVVEPREVLPVSHDPDDDKFLACAGMAGAEYLVTEDRDLLILETYEGCRICQPAEFIELLLARRAQAE
jgi:predicted nucleic acid-binding protein